MINSTPNQSLCRIRTITAFITLPKDTSQWYAVLADGKRQCDTLADAFTQAGYTVQSLRLVTNPFGEYLDTSSLASAKAGLTQITQQLSRLNKHSNLRIRFAIGEAQSKHELELLPELIQEFGDLCNACVNVGINDYGILDNEHIKQAVEVVKRIARITPNGEGNFNFTVNFNCQPYIPYFPASYHHSQCNHQNSQPKKRQVNAIVLGLETPDLLVSALTQSQNNQSTKPLDLTHDAKMVIAYHTMHHTLQTQVDKIMAIVADTALDTDWQVLGLDTSSAPSKNCASMVDIYRLLGVPYFGASGTVEASSLLTRVFKSIKVPQVGFSGLMLAVSEDTGLAQATMQGEFDIRSLLTYSSVCGIGLDTVPIAGDTPADKICALMRDVGTMAYRLNKPLTVRLFPVPNKQAGDMTEFSSDDLCNSRIMVVP